jgi:hypothetical protein
MSLIYQTKDLYCKWVSISMSHRGKRIRIKHHTEKLRKIIEIIKIYKLMSNRK